MIDVYCLKIIDVLKRLMKSEIFTKIFVCSLNHYRK